MVKRQEVIIKQASLVVWEFSNYSEMGNAVLKYTIIDDETGITYTGKTRANSDFIDHVGRYPKKLVNVRIVGKVMTSAENN